MTEASPRETAAADRTHERIDWLHYTVVIAVFSITGSFSAFQPRRYSISLSWRGEMYSAGGRTDSPEGQAERSSVVSDIRLTLRAFQGHRYGTKEGEDPSEHPAFQDDLDDLIREVEASFPRLAPTITPPASPS